MRGYLFSASSAERVLACPASAVLPSATWTLAVALRGTWIHRFMTLVIRGTPVPQALASIPAEHREVCAALDMKVLLGGIECPSSEIAYAVNVETGDCDEFTTIEDRAYPAWLGEQHVPGSIDIQGTRFDGIETVRDLKTGFDAVTKAQQNAQLKVYALARALRTGAEAVEGAVMYARPDGRVYADWAEWSRFDLDCFQDELKDALDRVRSARDEFSKGHLPVVNMGDHCKYCPAFASCPAQTSLAKSMGSDLLDIQSRIALMTLEQRGAAYEKLLTIGKVYDQVEKALKVLAAQEPIPIGGDKEAREITFSKSLFDKAAALALLESLGATPEQIASLNKEREESQIRVVKRKREAS